jgi:hypothetical protein
LEVAIAIPRVYGSPEGLEIELRLISAADGDELDSRLYRAWQQGQLMLDERGLLPPEMLRVAVEFADGTSVTNVTLLARDLELAPDGPGDIRAKWRRRRLQLAAIALGLAASATRRHQLHLRMARPEDPSHSQHDRLTADSRGGQPRRRPVSSTSAAAQALVIESRATGCQPTIRFLRHCP